MEGESFVLVGRGHLYSRLRRIKVRLAVSRGGGLSEWSQTPQPGTASQCDARFNQSSLWWCGERTRAARTLVSGAPNPRQSRTACFSCQRPLASLDKVPSQMPAACAPPRSKPLCHYYCCCCCRRETLHDPKHSSSSVCRRRRRGSNASGDCAVAGQGGHGGARIQSARRLFCCAATPPLLTRGRVAGVVLWG